MPVIYGRAHVDEADHIGGSTVSGRCSVAQPDLPAQRYCFISIYILKDGRTVEKLTLGKDGFIGIPFLYGETRFLCHAITVISGSASWISVHEFNDAAARFSCILPALQSYTIRVIKQLILSVICASVHSASQHIATWLLFADDRSQTSSFDITQRTLANIFGLRLATVGDACAKLGAAGAIDHSRGTMAIADRGILEGQACGCYHAVRS